MKNRFLTLASLTILFQANVYAKDTITLYTGDFPPYSKINMKDQGYSSAIVAEAFKASGRKVQIIFYPWPRALNALKKAGNSASYPWAMNKERQQEYFYSDVIHEDEIKFFGKKDTTLEKGKICYPHGWDTSQFDFALNKYEMKITARPNDIIQCFEMIKRGRIDFTFLNEKAGHYKLQMLNLDHEIVARSEITADDFTYLIASKKSSKSKDIIDDFNKGLAIIKKKGRFQEIKNSFFEARIKTY